MREYGIIISLRDGIGVINGLPFIAFGEVVYSGSNLGIILHLGSVNISAAFFSERELRVNDRVFRTNYLPSIFIFSGIFGCVLNLFGLSESELLLKEGFYSLYMRSAIAEELLVEVKAPGIIERQSVYESLPPGIRIIDGLIQVGLGQRELIIGDRKTGKTAIVLDMFLNQLRTPVFFNYK